MIADAKDRAVHGHDQRLICIRGLALSFGAARRRRRSFSPDAAFHVGNLTMDFIEGSPIYAVEVRSNSEYGPAAERAMAAKRVDYFAAGTLVVWDVDLRAKVVRAYRASDPDRPTIYHPGESAEAEPALPGWSMPVDDLPADALARRHGNSAHRRQPIDAVQALVAGITEPIRPGSLSSGRRPG